ncbi:MAG: DegV family protein [Dehalococcoidia bacterium]|nr:DegV family protein [Dehalococcoidia bacterium]
MTLRVVTDSTCDLPPDLVSSLNVTVIPCNIHFGQEAFRDGVDMKSEQFYTRLTGTVYPKTSQPSVESFLEGYRGLGDKVGEVLSLHVSSKLSTTVTAAQLAAKELGKVPRIEVVDSLQASLGLGLLVMEAARIAQAGGNLQDALTFVDHERSKITSYFAVDTLEYLVKGGRASKAQAFLGSLLSIKPILAVKDDGEVHPVERVRTRKRVLERLAELAASAGTIRGMGVLHSVAAEDAEALATACSAHFPRGKIVLSQFSAVLGCHLGPRALGLVLWTD